MLKVGLTGGIACGKTTVAEMFERLGCVVFYADRIAHRLCAPGEPAYQEIVREFGKGILDAGQAIDRAALAAIIFADPPRRERLNQIVHPRVIEYLERELERIEARQADSIAMVEAALLIESGYHRRLDKLVVVWCEPEQQLARLRERFGLAADEARQRLAAQMSSEEKRAYADYVVDCSHTLENTRAQVEELFRTFRAMVGARA